MGGAPVVMSSPYFYQSPPELRQNLKNFPEPIPSEHETQLDIEPITGMAIKIHKRIQVKFLLLASVTYKIRLTHLQFRLPNFFQIAQ